ncbi:pheromone receptor transcription activator-like [Triticum dicoccoides]|uniref:pheromone receptor transcription activator-like n=1 Tax=Triticum dicoccoides TaxID=85692 RepID=UPI000842A205|nr:pheromone receptor transcription activator-like [Triticum dicoccoides]XP_044424242.1 pheromone receptor transcription activator-like [Triticum aestivum]
MWLANSTPKSLVFYRSLCFLFVVVTFFLFVHISMPRKERRSGVAYIQNDKDRDLTFYKRRSGLFKRATDISSLTGARVAVVLETNNGKMHSFGTPLADPIVDAFLFGARTAVPSVDEATTARIGSVQNEVAQLDMENMSEEDKNQLSILRMKNIQEENPCMVANLIFTKEQDLGLEDLNKLFSELSRVQKDIRFRLPPLHGREDKTGGTCVAQDLQLPSVLPADHLGTTHSLMQSSWPHNLSQLQLPLDPLPPQPEQTPAPLFPMQAPQMFHSAPTSLAPHLDSHVQPIPNQVHEQTPPEELHVQNYESPCNIVQPQKNDANHDSTSGKNLEASALLGYSSGNALSIDDPFNTEQWGYALSDQSCYNSFLGMDAYLGSSGTDLGQSSMVNGGWVDVSPSSTGQDIDILTDYGELL